MVTSQVNKSDLIERIKIQRTLAIKKSRVSFYTFCRTVLPEFYKSDRLYLKDLCDTLQDFYEGKITKRILLINIPPRHGKSLTATLFVCWIFGLNPRTKIITSSYAQTISELFAQQTRDMIAARNDTIENVAVNEVFPELSIRYGDSAKGFWSLEGSTQKNYLATSPGGASTGIGANFALVDDAVKSAEMAYNQRDLEKTWLWYNNTLAQRLEDPRKQIVIMTRWSSEDLAGRLLKQREKDVHQVIYTAVQPDGSMLCSDIMSYEDFMFITQEMGKDIVEANYNQHPIDLGDQLYSNLQEYEEAPEFVRVISYTDTADEGKDYLASIICGIDRSGDAYVLDIYYTTEGMEVTEEEVARRQVEFGVNIAYIESNNGGRGFGRSVKRIVKEKYKTNKTNFVLFHQSKNKEARILSNSTWVMNHIYFPMMWEDFFKEAYMSMVRYKRKGTNEHDDIQDAITGIAEKAGAVGGLSFL